MPDLKDFYRFHAYSPHKVIPYESRYHAVSRIIAWVATGEYPLEKVRVEIQAGDTWIEDRGWRIMFDQRFAAEQEKHKKNPKPTANTLSLQLKNLARTLRVVAPMESLPRELLVSLESELQNTLDIIRSNVKLLVQHTQSEE